jgi:hypothetical protein
MPTTIGSLAVTMVQRPLDALLMPAIGCPMLPAPRLGPALRAAIALPAITTRADPKHRAAARIMAKPQPEYNFFVNRHPLLQAAFDNRSGSCQGKVKSGLPSLLA